MLITFSIPSIRELKVITHCVRDLYEKADDPENIEVIVRLDEEDNRDEGFINNIKGAGGEYKDNVKVIVGKKMYGYCSGPDMNKEIIDIMKGEWLFIYNDDCKSITKGYDSIIKKYNGKMVLLSTKNDCNEFDFGIYPKKFIEVNGRLQYSCYTNWDMETWQKYFPELFVFKELYPKAELPSPVELSSKEKVPIAVLLSPEMLFSKALSPTAVFQEPPWF